RRHTRFSRDWSSDVCSSDLINQLFQAAAEMDTERFNYLLDLHFSLFHHQTVFFYIIAPLMVRIGEAWEDGVISVAHEHMITHIRSEERRVGKERGAV